MMLYVLLVAAIFASGVTSQNGAEGPEGSNEGVNGAAIQDVVQGPGGSNDQRSDGPSYYSVDGANHNLFSSW